MKLVGFGNGLRVRYGWETNEEGKVSLGESLRRERDWFSDRESIG